MHFKLSQTKQLALSVPKDPKFEIGYENGYVIFFFIAMTSSMAEYFPFSPYSS